MLIRKKPKASYKVYRSLRGLAPKKKQLLRLSYGQNGLIWYILNLDPDSPRFLFVITYERNQQILGWICTSKYGRGFLHLDIYVRIKERRKGLGSKLIIKAQKLLKKNGIKTKRKFDVAHYCAPGFFNTVGISR